MAGGLRGILELCGVWLAKPGVEQAGGTPSATYPMGHRASLTLPAGVSKLVAGVAQWRSRPRTIDVTGRSFAGVDDTSKAFARGLPGEEISLSGWVRGSKVGFGHRSSLTIGTVLVDPFAWTLTKTWPLYPIAGRSFGGASGGGGHDGRGKWTWGVPVYALSFTGQPQNTGPLIETEQFLVTIQAASIGTIAFARGIHADRWALTVPLMERAGRSRCSFGGRYEGPIVYTPGSKPNDLSWLLINPAVLEDKPVRGDVELDTGAESVAVAALLYSVTLYFNEARGGQIRFDARLRVDSEMT